MPPFHRFHRCTPWQIRNRLSRPSGPRLYRIMATGAPVAKIHSSLLHRITIDPEVRFGKPYIRGHRITVQKLLEWLSSGASQQQILTDYPQPEPEDFLAVYAYAAELAPGARRPVDEASLRRKPFAEARRAESLYCPAPKRG